MGSKPRRQKRAATPRPTPTSVEHATIDVSEALDTVANPRSPEGFATAFANAFLYLPEDPEPVDVPAPASVEVAAGPAGDTAPEAVAAEEPAPAPVRRSRAKKGDAADTPAAAPKKPKASGATRGDRRKTVTAATDTPAKGAPRRRKTDAVVAEAPPVAAEPSPAVDPVDTWVDLVLEPTPPAPTTDEWMDQVIEPTKLPMPRPRPVVARTDRPTAKPVVKAPATAARRVVAPAAKGAGASATDVAPTRWWLVAMAFVLVAIVAIANRPSRGHAPLPREVLGVWTTEFWRYDHQTLELLPDTVVLTLDESQEGRFPITKVETVDAGRETAVTLSYRVHNGEERVLDFLADRDPTTALRFRAHIGLIWVRPSP